MENPSNSTGHLQKDSLLSTIYGYTTTPVPGIINAALLLSTPLVSEQMQNPANAIERASRFRAVNVLTRPQYLGPSKKVALLFGGANALGAWMIHDHDLESGAGFLAAWSTLYLVVGGRGSIKALKYGKFWPLVLAVGSGANAMLYTRRFISGSGAMA
ncbi:AIM19 (YIL087C) [Zygosaccharomyces parabailii]|nr:AIM19 (YIL087C) [Zygosaccharomyces parabailii]CDH13635.1 related to Altered inheritance of mitochondria protein 19, mitochondrial [Zygosaccharomyces bailii ISA1307]